MRTTPITPNAGGTVAMGLSLIQIGAPAAPDRLACIIGDDAGAALLVLGVTREEVGDE